MITHYYHLCWHATFVTLSVNFSHSKIEQIYRLLALEPLPISPPLACDFILKESNDGYLLQVSQQNYFFPHIDDLIVNTTNKISMKFLERANCLLMHSGALIVNNRALLFSGLSHAGKTSLALNAWRAGITIIGDDLLACDPHQNTVMSFPKPLRVRLPDATSVPPKDICQYAGEENIVSGQFLYDAGFFVGRHARHILVYEKPVKVHKMYFIEQGSQTNLMPLNAQLSLTLALTQVYPNACSLQIAPMIQALAKQNHLYRLTIGLHAFQDALEIMCESNSTTDSIA